MKKRIVFRVVFRIFAASNGRKIQNRTTMNALEKQFAQTVAEHKSTIYTVCYMFSQDADEVNDLFQEVLVNLWIPVSPSTGRRSVAHPKSG